jgi:hypothetical protein
VPKGLAAPHVAAERSQMESWHNSIHQVWKLIFNNLQLQTGSARSLLFTMPSMHLDSRQSAGFGLNPAFFPDFQGKWRFFTSRLSSKPSLKLFQNGHQD